MGTRLGTIGASGPPGPEPARRAAELRPRYHGLTILAGWDAGLRSYWLEVTRVPPPEHAEDRLVFRAGQAEREIPDLAALAAMLSPYAETDEPALRRLLEETAGTSLPAGAPAAAWRPAEGTQPAG
ncbi:hypothetical protein [Pseudoroseomonas sp. WGS1072]|uniref:hypothetical protein n=1 Tax=Roseomonas sp. WGS1072 TaxID=3366816 RepID=UPI003BF0C4C4